MTVWKMIGLAMFASLIISFFTVVAKDIGKWEAAKLFAKIYGMMLFVSVSMALIDGKLP